MARFYGKYPSVTTVLKALGEDQGLLDWKARVGSKEADRISRERMAIGHLVHYRLSSWASKRTGSRLAPLDVDRSVLPANAAEIVSEMWNQLQRWIELYQVDPILSETKVVSHQHGYAGTFDLLANLDTGIPFVLDLKTSKGVYALEKWEAQLAAYHGADRPPGAPVWGEKCMAAVIRVHETTGDPEFVKIDLNRGWRLFQLALKKWGEANGRKTE